MQSKNNVLGIVLALIVGVAIGYAFHGSNIKVQDQQGAAATSKTADTSLALATGAQCTGSNGDGSHYVGHIVNGNCIPNSTTNMYLANSTSGSKAVATKLATKLFSSDMQKNLTNILSNTTMSFSDRMSSAVGSAATSLSGNSTNTVTCWSQTICGVGGWDNWVDIHCSDGSWGYSTFAGVCVD